jgi:hypothetical protein
MFVCFLKSIVLGSIADNTNVFVAGGNAISSDINHDDIALHAACRTIITHILRQDSDTHIVVNILQLPQQYPSPISPLLSKQRAGARKTIVRRTAPPSSTMMKRVQTHND